MRNVPSPTAEIPNSGDRGSAHGDRPKSSANNGGKSPNVSNTGGYRDRVVMSKGLSLAFEFAGAVFLFWFAGRLVDNWLGIEPWGQVVGAVVGWIGGTLHVYYAGQRSQAE
jgi:F0F1-type ATP synthase assembly protein I